MALHNDTGKSGEDLAVAWLQAKGYILLHKNWRHSHYEVDVIATLNDCLHFIEVKTRTTQRFGNPEESVSRTKIKNLMEAADAFTQNYHAYKRIQFDVLAINIINEKPAYFFIEDVYL